MTPDKVREQTWLEILDIELSAVLGLANDRQRVVAPPGLIRTHTHTDENDIHRQDLSTRRYFQSLLIGPEEAQSENNPSDRKRPSNKNAHATQMLKSECLDTNRLIL